MRALERRVPLVGLLGLLVGCDHVTKYVAKAQLEGEPPRDLIRGVLDLRYAENTDVAFNLLRWVPEEPRTTLLAIVGTVVVLALVVALLRRGAPRPTTLALLLVAAGAVGNHADRLLRGYVVDFVHLSHWPVFNVADVYLTVGGVLIALAAVARPSARPA